MLRYWLVSILLFGTPASSFSQSVAASALGVRPALRTDSGTWRQGERAGRLAAAHTPVGGRAALGFLGGLSLGFFGLSAADGSPVAMIA